MEQTTDGKQSIFTKLKGRGWRIVLLVIAIIILMGLVIWLFFAWRSNAVKVKDLENTIAQTQTSTTTVAAIETSPEEISTTTSTSSNQYLEACRSSAEGFMNARLNRNIEEAVPYVTPGFLANYDQAAFAGTSSPSVSGYDIGTIATMQEGANYDVPVIVHWTLNSEPTDDSSWTLYSLILDGKCLVDDYTSS